MLSARLGSRAASRHLPRAIRAARPSPHPHRRFQSTTSSTSQPSSSGASHVAAGLAGGLAAAVIFYGFYLTSPMGKMARTVNKQTAEINKMYKEAAAKLQQSTPDADHAVNYIKGLCYSYVAWIPGGRQYVDAAFRDLDKVREKHHDEADKILNEAYKQFQDLSKSGLSLETARKAADVLADLSKKMADLAGDALGDIIDNHPELKDKLGNNLSELKRMGERYGPEAKKQVEQTWKQVSDLVQGGLSGGNLEKARKIVEEKTEAMKKMSEEAWKKGMEQARPYLDKNPKIKELVEKNSNALKEGNVGELFEQAKKAADSGKTEGLEKYVDQAVRNTKLTGKQAGEKSGLNQYFEKIPQGGDILTKLKQLEEVAENHADEGQQLLKETMEEVKQVLENKAKRAEEIASKGKKEMK